MAMSVAPVRESVGARVARELADAFEEKFGVQAATQRDLDAIARKFKPALMRSTAVYMFQPLPTYKQMHDVHMHAGFELGFLEVIDDEAYKKATNRHRTIVVYRDPVREAKENLK